MNSEKERIKNLLRGRWTEINKHSPVNYSHLEFLSVNFRNMKSIKHEGNSVFIEIEINNKIYENQLLAIGKNHLLMHDKATFIVCERIP